MTYTNEPTMHLICEALKQGDLSAKGIAEKANIDPTSENFREIEQHCWDLVDHGFAKPIDLRDAPRVETLFFSMIVA